MQGAAADPEPLGGLGPVAFAFFKGAHDEPMFGLMQIQIAARNQKTSFSGCPAARVPQGGREITDSDFCAGGHYDTMFNGGAQLADIARPMIGEDGLHCLGGQFPWRFGIFFRKLFEKGVDEQGNIFFAFAKGGEGDLDHIQTIKQIIAKLPFSNHLFQILIGRRHKSHIHFDGAIPPHPLEGAILPQNPEHLDLEICVDFPDLVQKERTAVALLEAARTLEISPRSAGRLWSFARAWLRREIEGANDDERIF